MGRKRRFAKRGCFSVVAVVACLVMLYTSAEKYATNRHTLPGNTASWKQSGNFIVGYGLVRELYSSNVQNTYQVFSSDGQWLDETTQRGGYYSTVIPTRHGTYLYTGAFGVAVVNGVYR